MEKRGRSPPASRYRRGTSGRVSTPHGKTRSLPHRQLTRKVSGICPSFNSSWKNAVAPPSLSAVGASPRRKFQLLMEKRGRSPGSGLQLLMYGYFVSTPHGKTRSLPRRLPSSKCGRRRVSTPHGKTRSLPLTISSHGGFFLYVSTPHGKTRSLPQSLPRPW